MDDDSDNDAPAETRSPQAQTDEPLADTPAPGAPPSTSRMAHIMPLVNKQIACSAHASLRPTKPAEKWRQPSLDVQRLLSDIASQASVLQRVLHSAGIILQRVLSRACMHACICRRFER